MTKALVKQDTIPALSIEAFTATPTGLVVSNGDVPFEAWQAYGGALRRVEGAIHWVIGDWLNFGERAYGEKYSQAISDETGYKYSTLSTNSWLSKQIEFCRRRQSLSWSLHAEVGALEPDEQDYWLDIAESEDLSRNILRARIKEARRKAQEPKPAPMPSSQSPRLIAGCAEDMWQIPEGSIDLIITSPPYNLGRDKWPMGGDGRTPRDDGIGYSVYGDGMPEDIYQEWQLECLVEMWRVAKQGASLFYNHKVRNRSGRIIHPMDWLRNEVNPWTIRQEIIWDRGSTHNHSATLFWPEDERIYWMTKGRPELPDRSIGSSVIWRFHGPVVGTWHPAPFCEELPHRCIQAVGRDRITVLDPFAGSCTTLKVALGYGYDAVGVDLSREYLEKARIENGWTRESET